MGGKLKEMIPTFGKTLFDNEVLAHDTRVRTHGVLGLKLE